MNGLGIWAFIITIFVMVLFHEFGHYWTARKFGIKVEEFFIGFGPRIWSFRRGETEFGIKALPLGGYVRIIGMNPFQEVPEEDLPRTMGAKPRWQRAVVLVAGSLTHFILATVVFFVVFAVVGVQDPEKPTTRVETTDVQVAGKVGPAKTAGLRAGDRIVGIDGKAVTRWEQIRNEIRTSPGQALVLDVERAGRRISIEVVPVETELPVARDSDKTEKVGQIGIIPVLQRVKEPPARAAAMAFTSTGKTIVVSVKGIGQIFSPSGVGGVLGALRETGRREITGDEPIGLVGAARLSGNAASSGGIEMLIFFLNGFIVFVGVANLIPLPPLDGGYLAVLAVEAITRRKIDLRKLVPLMGAVLAFLIILNVALLYLDITRPFSNPF